MLATDFWLLMPDLYNSFIRRILELMDLMVVFETIRLPISSVCDKI
jgi:hypothetical protein